MDKLKIDNGVFLNGEELKNIISMNINTGEDKVSTVDLKIAVEVEGLDCEKNDDEVIIDTPNLSSVNYAVKIGDSFLSKTGTYLTDSIHSIKIGEELDEDTLFNSPLLASAVQGMAEERGIDSELLEIRLVKDNRYIVTPYVLEE